MRWLIWYVRSLFCTHEWDIKETPWQVFKDGDEPGNDLPIRCGRTTSMLCTRCGWHRKVLRAGINV